MCKPPKKSHGAPVINRPDNILQEDYTLPMDPWPLSQKVLNPLVIIPQSHFLSEATAGSIGKSNVEAVFA